MLRSNHYEAALSAFLRARRQPYVAVNEMHRAPAPDSEATIKNLDFVISVPERHSWLVDVKGRHFPSGNGKNRVYWKQWSSWDDMVGMKHWESYFGERFSGLFVFTYLIRGDRSPLPAESLFEYRKRLYAFLGIELAHYISESRLVSPKWRLYAMPARRFRHLARPLEAFLD